ncbi:hypothetical protein SLEP1_g22196 [Rubroshorea leprosula]|uniref:Uncharacterized protein n=1 Tax=Rubroshorea leprosula TaxID=152421 RepID=A0AAV5JEJ4_9ROSI|nr:hypothetical protein SLEP1_g22196 [Rubroshorea leprosula]
MSFPCTSRRSPQATAPIFARKFWFLIIGCPSTWVKSFVLHDLM